MGNARTAWLKTKMQFTTIMEPEIGSKLEAIAVKLHASKKIKEPTRYEITRYALKLLAAAHPDVKGVETKSSIITSNPIAN